MRVFQFLILLVVITFYSCSKDKDDEVVPDIGHNYAGLEAGKYVVYDVDSIFYDDFTNTVDTSIFQIKEVVDELFTDLEGEDAFKIIRYKKEKDSTNWVLQDVWNSKLTQTNFQKVEENVRLVKLVFPVRENVTWNGNSMNNQPEMRYQYTYIDQSEVIGGNSLTNVLKVLQYEDINLISQELFEEKYARNVGMVYKKSMDLTRNNLSAPWRGYDITMTLSSYGN
jgi:hypothetical protein